MTRDEVQRLAREHLDKHCKYDSNWFHWYVVIQGIMHPVAHNSDIVQNKWKYINEMLAFYSLPSLPFDPNVKYNDVLSLGEFISLKEAMSTCSHVYKKYVGLMETFEYCDKCGEKKNEA